MDPLHHLLVIALMVTAAWGYHQWGKRLDAEAKMNQLFRELHENPRPPAMIDEKEDGDFFLEEDEFEDDDDPDEGDEELLDHEVDEEEKSESGRSDASA